MAERQDIMLCYQYDEKRLLRYKKPFFVQPKIEGDRCRSLITKNGVQLLSSSAKDRNFAVPHIAKQLDIKEVMELDGELFLPGMIHEEIRSIVSRTEMRHPDHLVMEYHVFDIVDDIPQWVRLERLESLFLNNSQWASIMRVPTYICGDAEEVEYYFDEFVNQGYEGIIIRDRNAPYVRRRTTTMMKLKPRKSMLCVVKGGFEEMTMDGQLKGTLGGFEVINANEIEFRVGTGFTKEQREQWWPFPTTLYGVIIRITYQSLTTNNVPKMAAFKEII